uniref:Zona pellucida sperm-binding protein 3 n=1 Tax=Electrophorus electricus TaxID=8005 RepID=A0A4W4EU03_ELEEL
MLKLTLFVTALICQELGNLFAYPDISDNELYYFQTSERLPAKKPDRQLKEQFSGPNILVTTVAVTCLPAYMVITVKADLFNIGLPVNAADLRLGTESQHGTSCGVIATSADEYIIEAPLTDCGTQHWVTEDALVYTNLLFYSPEPSLDGLVQTEDAVIPIKCYYGRRFNVDANPILPTWIPHQSTQFAVENLAFSLKLMTDDWHETRLSSVYLLGDMMNMEASVYMPQKDLLVFIETCVATTTPNTNSVPRYKFVDDGCVLDGQQTGSKSHFLPRPQPNKLQLQLQSFIFPQMCCEIYVTCVLKAYPLNHASGSKSKACSFIDGRWRSAEGDDQTCTSCNDVDQDPPFHQSHLDLATPIYNLKHNPTKLLPSPHRWGVLTPGMQADSAVLSPGSGSVISQSLQEPTAAWRSTMAFQKGTNLRSKSCYPI